ncbi:unnamed protein product [Rotaria magnacalcarata]
MVEVVVFNTTVVVVFVMVVVGIEELLAVVEPFVLCRTAVLPILVKPDVTGGIKELPTVVGTLVTSRTAPAVHDVPIELMIVILLLSALNVIDNVMILIVSVIEYPPV